MNKLSVINCIHVARIINIFIIKTKQKTYYEIIKIIMIITIKLVMVIITFIGLWFILRSKKKNENKVQSKYKYAIQ